MTAARVQRGRRRPGARLLGIVLLVLLVMLQFSLWGDDGLLHWWSLRDANEQERLINHGLKEQNEALAREVRDVKTGVSAIEEKAREDLGMVKPGEMFFRVIERGAGAESGPDDGPDERRERVRE